MVEGYRTLELAQRPTWLFRCACHASEGDYRDWQAIDNWAAAIAQQLQQGRIGAGGPDARHAPEVAGGTPPIAACRRGRKQFKTSQGAASCSPEVAP
jgi:hypothetical protein